MSNGVTVHDFGRPRPTHYQLQVDRGLEFTVPSLQERARKVNSQLLTRATANCVLKALITPSSIPVDPAQLALMGKLRLEREQF